MVRRRALSSTRTDAWAPIARWGWRSGLSHCPHRTPCGKLPIEPHGASRAGAHMTMTKSVRTDENGYARTHYTSDDPNKVAMLTGPLYGKFELADGTVYNVNEDWIEVEPHHVGELSHHIGVYHEDNGHPLHDDGFPFVHLCTPVCGEHARDLDETLDNYRERVGDAWGDHHDVFAAHLGREHARHLAPTED